MSKVMFVTVGTSLFQSATWQPRPEDCPSTLGLPARIEGYSRWLEPGCQGSPEQRSQIDHNRKTRDDLRDALTQGNAAKWAAFLPEGLAEATNIPIPMRFSAEVATIAQLAMDEGEERGEAISVRDFLRGYERVHVVADPETGGEEEHRSRIAAAHLVAYLNSIADQEPAQILPAPGIASTDAAQVGAGLGALLRRIDRYRERSDATQLDFLLSGGYKLYGFFLAPLTLHYETENVRLIYMHETGNRAVVITADNLRLGGRSFSGPYSSIGLGG